MIGLTISPKEKDDNTNVPIIDVTLDDKKRGICFKFDYIHGKTSVHFSTESDSLHCSFKLNPEVIFKNTRFAKSNAHLRLQSRGHFAVENCDFTLPILLTGDTNYWFESSPVRDLTIKNCRFIGERATIRIIPEFTPTKAAPFYHSGIKITDNSFDSVSPLYARYAKDIVFKNNRIAGGVKPKLELQDCINVEKKK